MQSAKAAAFFDFDGTLCSTNVVHAYAFIAREQATLWRSLKKTAQLAAAIPGYILQDQHSRAGFNRLFFKIYRGQSADRLQCLNDRLYAEVIAPAIYPQARELVQRCKHIGQEPILVTGALSTVAQKVALDLGFESWVANHLHFDSSGRCTGEVVEPLMAGTTKARWIQNYAKQHAYDLSRSAAYSDSYSDLPMLSCVGRPTVINPDRKLKRIAQESYWPILNWQRD